MKALIIYDSFFGNTEKIAMAIGESLGGADAVRVADVKAGQLQGLDLVLVGSPTRAFRPSDGTRAFLKGLPAGALKGVRVAAFDTRIEMKDSVPGILRFMEKIFGYAADPIGKALASKGGTLVAPPEGFIVDGTEGPLKDGELARAAQWAKTLAA